jgi:magnesium transporter
MLKAFEVENERLRQVELGAQAQAIWVDLLSPSSQERQAVEGWLGVGIPNREDMEEIEISSRIYTEKDAHFMTATVPAQTDTDKPEMGPVAFILLGGKLATVRYHKPRVFEDFAERAEKVPLGCTSGDVILLSLLEIIIDRIADVLERASKDILVISERIFNPRVKKASKRDQHFHTVLREIGRKEHLISNLQDSLLTLKRVSTYLALVPRPSGSDTAGRIKTLTRDVGSLAEHAAGLSQKINFLLDATLGMINIEQSAIIKIFSVAAVVFLPPTLVASIYGMNFDIMPELNSRFGYPMALGLMVLSALLPYLYFKRRGWL